MCVIRTIIFQCLQRFTLWLIDHFEILVILLESGSSGLVLAALRFGVLFGSLLNLLSAYHLVGRHSMGLLAHWLPNIESNLTRRTSSTRSLVIWIRQHFEVSTAIHGIRQGAVGILPFRWRHRRSSTLLFRDDFVAFLFRLFFTILEKMDELMCFLHILMHDLLVLWPFLNRVHEIERPVVRTQIELFVNVVFHMF